MTIFSNNLTMSYLNISYLIILLLLIVLNNLANINLLLSITKMII